MQEDNKPLTLKQGLRLLISNHGIEAVLNNLAELSDEMVSHFRDEPSKGHIVSSWHGITMYLKYAVAQAHYLTMNESGFSPSLELDKPCPVCNQKKMHCVCGPYDND